MNEQEIRRVLADAILRGEAVCYGFHFELKPEGAFIDPREGFGSGYIVNNQFRADDDLGAFHIGTQSDGSPEKGS